MPWPLAIVLAVAVGVGTGAAVARVMRRFTNAPRLVVTVATIGLLQVFVGLQFLIPFIGGGQLIVAGFLTPFSDFNFTIGHSLFYGNDVLAVAIVPFVLIGLSLVPVGHRSRAPRCGRSPRTPSGPCCSGSPSTACRGSCG